MLSFQILSTRGFKYIYLPSKIYWKFLSQIGLDLPENSNVFPSCDIFQFTYRMLSLTGREFGILTKVPKRSHYFVRGKYVHEPKPIDPHPLGPAKNWRTSFVVDAVPRKTAPISPELSYKWLTKTRELLKEDGSVGLDNSFEKEKRDKELTTELMARVQHVIDSHAHLVKIHSHRTDAHFMGLLSNLLVYMSSCKVSYRISWFRDLIGWQSCITSFHWDNYK